MNALHRLLAMLMLTFALLGASPRSALAETLTCTTLSSLPATISTAGHYCLDANFSAAYAAAPITINASNVLLDCNDHAITQTGAASPNGITVNNQSLVVVRNCTLTGFARGIAFYETVAGSSRNNRIERNVLRRSKVTGIQVGGSANLVEGNRVSENTGLSGFDTTYGIMLTSAANSGSGNVVRNNIVTHIAPTVYVTINGIYLLDVDDSLIEGNTISALYPPLDKYAHGIVGGLNTIATVVSGNRIIAMPSGSLPPGGAGPMSYWGTNGDGIAFAGGSTSFLTVCTLNVVGRWQNDIVGDGVSGVGCYDNGNLKY